MTCHRGCRAPSTPALAATLSTLECLRRLAPVPCTIRASPRPSKAGACCTRCSASAGPEWRGLARAERARLRRRGRRARSPRCSAASEGATAAGDPPRPQGRPDARSTSGAASRSCRRPSSRSSRLGLCAFLEPTTSYVSVVELGMYEMTAQIHERLARARAEARHATSSSRPSTPRWRSSASASRAASSWRSRRPPPRLLLPDEQAARRAQELVRGAVRGARAHDARPRRDRPPLRGRGHPDHLRLDRLRRLGVGRRPLRRRPAGLQEAHLRDALRRGQRRGTPSSARSTSGLQFSPAELPRYLEGQVPALVP